MALESYLERKKFPPTLFETKKITSQHSKEKPLKTQSENKEINLKKADKATTTIIMDTGQKIQGLEQVSNENFYKPLETPLVSSTAVHVGNIVNTLRICSIMDTYDLQVAFFRPKTTANTRILNADKITQKHSCRLPN